MKKIVVLLFCGLVSLAIATNYEERKIFHYRSSAPILSDWQLLGTPNKDEVVAFSLALKQQNLDKLEKFFWANADPHNPAFAKHMTREQVASLISPPRSVTAKIFSWLKHTAERVPGIEKIDDRGDVIVVRASVEYVEALFQTKLHKFENPKKGKQVIKHLGELSVPVSVASHIDLITGITEFVPTRLPFLDGYSMEQGKVGDDDNQCNVPYTIKNLYNIPQNLYVTNENANQSIFAAEEGGPEGFGFGSVAYFEKINGLPNNPITCILGDGANNITPNDTDDEAQLDTQMMTGMAVNAKTCFWIIDGWMYDFTQNIFNTPTSPLVVSMSYGWLEWEQCDNYTDGDTFVGNCTALHIPNSAAYVARVNTEFMKLGAVGHSIIAASGDDGTAGNHNSPNDCTKIAPIFPAASPYLLAVGATSVEPSPSNKRASGAPPVCTNSQYDCVCSTSTNEQPAQQNNTAGFDTGGGFSDYTARPSYQQKAVSAYLSSGVPLPPNTFKWNQQGRGYPDVGAVGENFCVVDPGQPCSLAAGTSASAPLWASLITLLNNDRLNAGKTPLGFVNPIIYDMFDLDSQKYFNNQWDPSSNGGECGWDFGFKTKPGYWSPLVGCGSPKFDQIRAYVQSLP